MKKKKRPNTERLDQETKAKRVKPNENAVQPLQSLTEFQLTAASVTTNAGDFSIFPLDILTAILSWLSPDKKRMRATEVCKVFWRCWWTSRSSFHGSKSKLGNAELTIVLGGRLSPSSLRQFAMHSKKVNSAFTSLKKFKMVQHLDLSGCTETVSASLRPALKAMKNLQSLNLSGTLLRDDEALLIQRLTRLTSLVMSNCPLVREGVTFVSVVTCLRGLQELVWEAPAPWDLELVADVDNNNAAEDDADDGAGMVAFEHVTVLSALKRLSFALPRPGPLTCLQRLTNLQSVTLRRVYGIDSTHIQPWVSSLTGLTHLALLDSRIAAPKANGNEPDVRDPRWAQRDAPDPPSVLEVISHASQLLSLSLENTLAVSEENVEYLAALQSLHTLNLHRSYLDEDASANVEFLQSMPELRSLDLAYWGEVEDGNAELHGPVHRQLTHFNMRGTLPIGSVPQENYFPSDCRRINTKHFWGFERSMRQLQQPRKRRAPAAAQYAEADDDREDDDST